MHRGYPAVWYCGALKMKKKYGLCEEEIKKGQLSPCCSVEISSFDLHIETNRKANSGAQMHLKDPRLRCQKQANVPTRAYPVISSSTKHHFLSS